MLATIAVAEAPPSAVTGDAVLKYLGRSIDWYRRVNTLDQSPVNPQELLYSDSVRQSARQAIKLAFVFAHAQAIVLDGQSKTSATTRASGTTAHLQQSAAAADQRVQDLKSQLNDAYRSAKSPTDAARQAKLAAQLDLATTQRDALSQYAGFMVTATSGDATSLSDKIDQLEQSVPEISGDTAKPSVSAANSAGTTEAFHPESSGIITLISELFSLTGKMHALAELKDQAASLQKECDQIHAPLRVQVLDEIRRANSMGATTQDSSDPVQLENDRKSLETLASDFKTTSSAGIPLGEQSVLLASAAQNLASWHDALTRQYAVAIRSLVFRICGTVLIVILLVVVSELWRRATFKYVSDVRRRRQLMLVRRIVIGLIVLFIIIGSVVTEFGSLATFAGLITAGIAVSLQTVILSGVAYFFFIGRFGVRVGDRVTVSGITGDVVEIGLFRLYLMELTGPLTDLHSTGRMIVFSNAVLFQPSAFYKQLPGADYLWHELALTMSPDTDHDLAEKRLMEAVEAVFAGYRDTIDRQHAVANQLLHVYLESPRPQIRLRFVDAGVEMVIRYPVELAHASAIEDKLTRKLLEAIQQEPKLQMVASGTPRIQSVK